MAYLRDEYRPKNGTASIRNLSRYDTGALNIDHMLENTGKYHERLIAIFGDDSDPRIAKILIDSETMFEEMNLQWDLEKLERLRAYNQI